ncbi:signal peptidase II [Enterococcus sp. AZ109]|uniref:signal peptidase II n=1 Tax=Enterococcus sp. AZ109 TaxID=2774634 RepID=UPI003F1F065B
MNVLKRFAMPATILFLIDQLIKLMIKGFFIEDHFDMFGSFLRFYPVQNANLSYGGNFIGFLSNMPLLIVINLLTIWLLVSGYLLYRTKRKQTSTAVKVIMTFGLAGCFCSLIDKLVWNGSLDFIQLADFFIFDLKDVYLTIAEILFIVLACRHSNELSAKEYVHFCYYTFIKK